VAHASARGLLGVVGMKHIPGRSRVVAAAEGFRDRGADWMRSGPRSAAAAWRPASFNIASERSLAAMLPRTELGQGKAEAARRHSRHRGSCASQGCPSSCSHSSTLIHGFLVADADVPLHLCFHFVAVAVECDSSAKPAVEEFADPPLSSRAFSSNRFKRNIETGCNRPNL